MKIFYTSLLLLFTIMTTKAQTPMQISGPDCNGVNHDLFAELDAGKAVVVFFFMDACGSCPPVAAKVQTMCNSILSNYPGMITGYALPYINSTTCTATANWVVNNSLPLYSPYDSGAVQVANYGGFGMPTLAVVAGSSHEVLYTTVGYSSGDTADIATSIHGFFNTTVVNELPAVEGALTIFPNPVNTQFNVQFNLKEAAEVSIELFTLHGDKVSMLSTEKMKAGFVQKAFAASSFAPGLYLVKTTINGNSSFNKLNISH